MKDTKTRIKELIESTPAFSFTERRLVECRCRGDGAAPAYFSSQVLPPKGFIIMAAMGLSLTENPPGSFFRVGLSREAVIDNLAVSSALPFFKYFRYEDGQPSYFSLLKVGSFAYTDLSQLIIAPRLSIVTEFAGSTGVPYDVTFSLLIHKLHPKILSALESESPH